jgi:hypothetical protein
LQELPAPCLRIQPDPLWWRQQCDLDFFGLVSPRKNKGRIIFIN